jgi:sarcosine oxidase delta subunit
MDLWGHCTACERWFSMAGDTRTCPVCRSEPSAVADRAAEELAGGGTTERA